MTDPHMEREAEDEERAERAASADAEMAAFERQARRVARDEARGICHHGHRQGKSAGNREHWTNATPWESLAVGDELCLKCGEIIRANDPRNWTRQRQSAEDDARGRDWYDGTQDR